MARLQGFTWSGGNDLKPIKIVLPSIVNFYSTKTATYRDDEKVLIKASEIVDDEKALKDAISIVRTFTKDPGRTQLSEKFLKSLKLLANTVENQLEEVE